MAKKIKLSKEKFALVDEDDFDRTSRLKWHAHKKPRDGSFYACSNIRGGRGIIVKMHRLIMNAGPSEIVDHINGNGLDNRKRNLRICTKTQNCRNQGLRSDNRSGFKGVHQRGKKYRVQIQFMGKYINIGTFQDKISAARAYDAAAKKFHGEFARLNFP